MSADNIKSGKRLRKSQSLGPLFGFILIIIILSIISSDFLTITNIFNVLRQVSINALIAFGMTFVILTGGIDLSVGAILALSSAFTAGMLASGTNTWLAVLIGLFCGAIFGAVNGLLVTKGKVAPFIATLATMTVFRGFTLVYTQGKPMTGLNESFAFIGKGYFFDIPMPIVWMILIFIILYIVLKYTTFGRRVFALGSNEEATWLSGINTSGIKVLVYSISGLLAAFSGIILTSRLNSAQPTAGTSYELDAIAAVVLGGTSLSGGRGWLVGTLIGAMIIGVLDNGLNLLNVSSFYQLVVKGAVILVAVLMDRSKSSK
ncbi:ribose ABC transporter permease [Paenibacillus filicis]|uniref:Ribose ABC transporter permease n=1 Tax=Paenibacillus gyeongsangnamensis TaxID=3388067 RepID=A0ABT4Q204_9BACL|nr:ribose ABC transporter permease [Paenibacillus filicis]MCZ8510923.1 ribose ABC transporter permease [Paenibacillus filicis]